MKKYLILLTVCLGSFSLCLAQETKTGNNVNTDFVYSENGFVNLTGTFKVKGFKYIYRGCYTPDGKMLVKNGGIIISRQDQPTVAPGTEVILSGACMYDGPVYIPSTVKKIEKGAFGPKTIVYVYNVEDITDHKTGDDK